MSRSRDIANLLGSSSPIVDKTIIDAKGDLLIGSADNTITKLAAGAIGQLPLVDSSTSSGLRYVDPPTNRNLVINGAMTVAQYGSATSTAGGYYAADRFRYTRVTNTPSVVHTVENDGPAGTGLTKSRKILWSNSVTISASSGAFLIQHIEGQNCQQIMKGTSNAKPLTLSFWVKASVTGTYVVQLSDSDNNRSISAVYNIISSNTWEKEIITFPADTTGLLDNDNNQSLSITWWLFAGSDYTSGTLQSSWGTTVNNSQATGQVNAAESSNNFWQITGVQLEASPTPTPFEFESYEITLRKCQRYYYRQTCPTGTIFGTGWNNTTTSAQSWTYFPVPMRSAPTALESNGVANNYRVGHLNTFTTGAVAPSFVSATDNGAQTQLAVSSGLTQGDSSVLQSNNSSAYLAWSAEL